MITENINLIKLTASDGHILSNGEAYGNPIYLGKNDSIDNWFEITKEEYDKKMAELNKEE